METASGSRGAAGHVEAAWSYRHPARISPAIQKRQENLPRPVIDRAWNAQLRLCKRWPKERMLILQLLLSHVSWRVLSGIWAG